MELHKKRKKAKRKKAKILKALERGSTRLAQRLVPKCVDITSFCGRSGKRTRSLLTYSLTGRQPYFFPFYLTLLSSFLLLYSLSFYPYFPSILAWLKFYQILFRLLFAQKYSKSHFLSDLEKFPLSVYKFSTLAIGV